MALTQSAHTALRGPSWDEEVVPALRKRLENESRTLTRRLSTLEDQVVYNVGTSRQSSDMVEPESSSRRANPSNGARARTYSQPFRADSSSSGKTNGSTDPRINGTKSPVQSASRATSPRQFDAKPTRIPKPARRRADSAASNSYAVSPPSSINGHGASQLSKPMRREESNSHELWVPQEYPPLSTSHSTLSMASQQQILLQESPPFSSTSLQSSRANSDREDESNNTVANPRASIDSEETPYEHWYRGEVSRNGGVGELKVGKRKEMLDIANYGHTIRNNSPGTRNAVTEAIEAHRGRRKRAGSIGGMTGKERESFYLDEDRAKEAARVLDEGPLTDFEMSDKEDQDYYDEYSHSMAQALSTPTTPQPPQLDYRSTTPTPSDFQQPRSSSRQDRTPTSRMPNSRQGSDPPRQTTPTPTNMKRGASEPPLSSLTPSTSTPQKQQSRSPSSTTSTPNQKRRVSPAATPAASAKKTRTAASQATRAKLEAARKETLEKRGSVAHYPTPEQGLEDAIPTWTQPVAPRGGDWDDVVIPVVARKLGVTQGYEQADGSPRAPKVDDRIEPAPGTFGWDHSKYRPPRDDNGVEQIPMDEFGRPRYPKPCDNPIDNLDDDGQFASQNLTSRENMRVGTGSGMNGKPTMPETPSSPAPFTRYASTTDRLQPMPQLPTKLEMQQQPIQEDEGAGCCKCVMM